MRKVYHISHLFFGFIGDPNLQWNSSENSNKLDNGPMTRNFGGECGSFSICRLVVSSVTAEHQTCANETKKSCLCVYIISKLKTSIVKQILDSFI